MVGTGSGSELVTVKVNAVRVIGLLCKKLPFVVLQFVKGVDTKSFIENDIYSCRENSDNTQGVVTSMLYLVEGSLLLSQSSAVKESNKGVIRVPMYVASGKYIVVSSLE